MPTALCRSGGYQSDGTLRRLRRLGNRVVRSSVTIPSNLALSNPISRFGVPGPHWRLRLWRIEMLMYSLPCLKFPSNKKEGSRIYKFPPRKERRVKPATQQRRVARQSKSPRRSPPSRRLLQPRTPLTPVSNQVGVYSVVAVVPHLTTLLLLLTATASSLTLDSALYLPRRQYPRS